MFHSPRRLSRPDNVRGFSVNQRWNLRPSAFHSPTPGDRYAYKLRRPKNQATWLLNAAAFLNHYDLEALKGHAFPMRVEDGFVVVDLDPAS